MPCIVQTKVTAHAHKLAVRQPRALFPYFSHEDFAMPFIIRRFIHTAVLLALPMAALAHDHSHAESFWYGHPGKAADVKRTIKVAAADIKFMPTQIDIKAGETVRFEVVNDGKLEHEFVLGSAEEQAEHDKEMAAMAGMKMDHINGVNVAPGETGSLIWTFTKAGSLQYACHVPGHYAAGMLGTLTVK